MSRPSSKSQHRMQANAAAEDTSDALHSVLTNSSTIIEMGLTHIYSLKSNLNDRRYSNNLKKSNRTAIRIQNQRALCVPICVSGRSVEEIARDIRSLDVYTSNTEHWMWSIKTHRRILLPMKCCTWAHYGSTANIKLLVGCRYLRQSTGSVRTDVQSTGVIGKRIEARGQ
jgi:hypothetical protein